MLNVQFNVKSITDMKEILLRLRRGESTVEIQEFYMQSFKNVRIVDILLLQLNLLTGAHGITIEDVKKFSQMQSHLSEMNGEEKLSSYHPGHPIRIFKDENAAFQDVLGEINDLLTSFDADSNKLQETELVDQIKNLLFRLGEFHNHYHRKEKLFFPILERYGHVAPTRAVWEKDDQIRVLYQGLKGQVVQLPDVMLSRVLKKFDVFQEAFKEMIFYEEEIILPILENIFSEKDWIDIKNESHAFGYALIDAPREVWVSELEESVVEEKLRKQAASDALFRQTMKFGGGYLTPEEANLILNSLPLEITFIDKQGLFKYFNEMTEASEMMLVRTPSSIGRHVANCHPPKSLRKVMTVIRDLKTGIRESESMWFKKKDQYIHLTYKAIFNNDGEFLGVLEYVQDIQPFFELPSKVKTGISEIDYE
ncbi:PAS domain-containing protein [Sporosarcina sp. FSL W8-0480]|uniref:PAS domain-containing protein n=1 Tax=Sporosarcina sp. FSL W8-0480 TaxID=2954701 RepID=UPI0030DAAC80